MQTAPRVSASKQFHHNSQGSAPKLSEPLFELLRLRRSGGKFPEIKNDAVPLSHCILAFFKFSYYSETFYGTEYL